MSKIRLDDSLNDIIYKMSEGNPGATSVIMRILSNGSKIDPYLSLGSLGCVLALDQANIYGEKLWILYKDICSEDLIVLLAVIRLKQLVGLSIHNLINTNQPINKESILFEIREHLPNFGVEYENTINNMSKM